MRIEVTREYIEKGKPGCGECPIALALASRGFTEITVNLRTLSFKDKKGHFRYYAIPEKAIQFINMFDQYPSKDRQQIPPFSFCLVKQY